MAKRNLNLSKLPSNNLTTPDKKEVSIVKGKVRTKKGGGLARDVRNIGNSLFEDIVLPAIKSAVVDFFSNGVSMVMFGEDSRSNRGRQQSYNRMYRERPSRSNRRTQKRERYVEEVEEVFENVYFQHRDDAEHVLGRMMERVAEYGMVKVGDLNSLAGLATNYTHESWGWDDLSGSRVIFQRDGYVITFPAPIYLD